MVFGCLNFPILSNFESLPDPFENVREQEFPECFLVTTINWDYNFLEHGLTLKHEFLQRSNILIVYKDKDKKIKRIARMRRIQKNILTSTTAHKIFMHTFT